MELVGRRLSGNDIQHSRAISTMNLYPFNQSRITIRTTAFLTAKLMLVSLGVKRAGSLGFAAVGTRNSGKGRHTSSKENPANPGPRWCLDSAGIDGKGYGPELNRPFCGCGAKELVCRYRRDTTELNRLRGFHPECIHQRQPYPRNSKTPTRTALSRHSHCITDLAFVNRDL